MTNDDWFSIKGPGRCFIKVHRVFKSGENTSPTAAIQGLRKQIKFPSFQPSIQPPKIREGEEMTR